MDNPATPARAPRTAGLDGLVSVVTGAGQGLGRAFATRLAAEGSQVVVADLDSDRARAVAAELGQAGHAVRVDVSSEESVTAMRDEVLGRFGRADVLVNNAAVFSTITMKPFDKLSVAEWDGLMGVNVRGVFLCCRAFVPAMRRAGHGKIINVSSATFHEPRPRYLHYVTSKAAVIGLTRALAREVGEHGITVNALAPGATETEIPRETVTAEQVPLIIASQCIKRRERPSDLAGAVVFLASPDSDFMTGQTLVVDGGTAFC